MSKIYPLRGPAAAAIVRHRLAHLQRASANDAAELAVRLVAKGESVRRAVAMAELHGQRHGLIDSVLSMFGPRPETVRTNGNVRHIQRYRRQYRGIKPDGGPEAA